MADGDRSLASVAVFRHLPEDARREIERRCRWRTHQSSETILAYQDDGRDVYFLVSGAARAMIYSASGRAVAFREMGPGDFFGEFAAIDGRPRSASIEAATQCLVASLSPEAFRLVLTEHAGVALALIEHLIAQARLLTDRVYEFSTLAVNNRVHAELLRLARQVSPSDNEVCIRPAPTHANIASHISTHREAVSREMSRLAQIGVLRRRGDALWVTDMTRLARMVNEATGE